MEKLYSPQHSWNQIKRFLERLFPYLVLKAFFLYFLNQSKKHHWKIFYRYLEYVIQANTLTTRFYRNHFDQLSNSVTQKHLTYIKWLWVDFRLVNWLGLNALNVSNLFSLSHQANFDCAQAWNSNIKASSHGIFIKRVSSKYLLSALLNWILLVYGLSAG